MDICYSSAQESFRAECRAWLAVHVPAKKLPSFDASREGFEAHRAWERVLYAGGYGMVTWPTEYGGRGLDLIDWLIFEEEYFAAGAPLRVNQNGIFLLGPTIMEFGTYAQKARFLPSMAAGDEIWAQAWSEPQAGSDLAAVRATATRVGETYTLNGHKIWSSRAVYADWGFGLFRTDRESQRHHGLSLLLFPLNAPGVTVRPIAQIDGETGFAEIVLENVEISSDNRLGGEGQGWSVCMATAGFERGLMLRSPARFLTTAQKLVALAERHADRMAPALWESVAKCWMDAQAYALSVYATASRLVAGGSIGPEASTNKIFWSEMDIALHRTALEILGQDASLVGQPDDWLAGYLFSLAGPIYAGSNEIQRNIIAERMLGLPRG